MIKINLLPGAIEPVATREIAEAVPLRFSPVMLLGASALLCFTLVGTLGWYWSHETARLELEFNQERAEQARLAAIQKENLVYQKQVEELEHRVRTIQALEDHRTGPLDFMTALGATVNQTGSDLYLLSVSPEANRLVLKGQSQSVKSIAGFIAALRRSNRFDGVKLRQYYQEDQAERVAFKFDLECVYQPGVSAASPPAKGGVTGASAAHTGP